MRRLTAQHVHGEPLVGHMDAYKPRGGDSPRLRALPDMENDRARNQLCHTMMGQPIVEVAGHSFRPPQPGGTNQPPPPNLPSEAAPASPRIPRQIPVRVPTHSGSNATRTPASIATPLHSAASRRSSLAPANWSTSSPTVAANACRSASSSCDSATIASTTVAVDSVPFRPLLTAHASPSLLSRMSDPLDRGEVSTPTAEGVTKQRSRQACAHPRTRASDHSRLHADYKSQSLPHTNRTSLVQEPIAKF